MSRQRNSQPIPRVFQIKFLLKFSAAVLIIFVVASLILYLLINGKFGDTYFNSLSFLNHLNRNLVKYLFYSLSFQFIFIALATLFISLFASHKIAGPLIRLEKTCEQIGRGELPQSLKIRAKDQVQNLAQSMDNFIQELRRRIERIGVRKENIKDKKQEINRFFKEKRLDLVQKEFKKFESELEAVESILNLFKIE
ncbi:MAG: HAMP domain-containing protein [Fidelibacterota bacterium]